MKTAALVALAFFLCVADGTLSDDTVERKCSGYCKESAKFKYQPGHTYIYDYRIDTSSGISVTAKEESRLHLAALAEISVISPCDFRLKLRDVVLEDSLSSNTAQHNHVPGMAEISEALEKNPLLFSFQDGKVEELCPSSDDSPWVMNIKRGVLSIFQNSMSSLELEENVVYEKDVTGLCETRYTTSSSTLPMVVMKNKDLLSCTHRLDHYLSLQSTPYTSTMNAHSSPLIKSQHSCKQNIGATGLLERAICYENHLFRPFSNGENGAKTKVSQYLILTEIVSSIQPELLGPAGFRTTLLYHHTQDDNVHPSQEQTVTLILEELEKKTKYGVESDVPRLFAQLVTDLKTFTYPQLSILFSNNQQTLMRKFLLDAISLVGTPDAVTLMVDLYKSKDIAERELDSWLTTLSFQKKPSIGMLTAVSTLLDRSPRPKAILSISAMVHSYCKIDTACDNEVVKNIIVKIEQLLGEDCNPRGEVHMQQIIIALKGIGNAGVVVQSLGTLKKCYQKDNPTEIRLAAIDAYRRLPCDVVSRSDLLDMYTNMHGDTEIRIAAYLAAMQCPSTQTFRYIKDILYKEEVNQVASFVWTHLTNMQETSTRWKQGIRALISNDFLKNKFSTDVRKFSRNYEASTYFDSINAGAGLESNVIFTPQSYMPRSAMLNLTLDLFGESFNVFEIGARAEGFEQTIESMFGPGGYFPDETVKKFLTNYRDKNNNEFDNSINKLSGAFDAKKKIRQDPEASLYARMFGNEFLYSRFKGLELLKAFDNTSYKDHIMKIALDEPTEYVKSFSLIDASYVMPTAAGLPLEFAVNGTASVGLKYGGVMSAKELTKGAISISGELAPSAAIEITGTMSIRAFTAKAGITSVNKLSTNSYLGGSVKIVQGKIVDVKINVPRDKIEFIDVSTKLFMVHRESQEEIEGIKKDREEQQGCTPDMISGLLGIKVCGQLAYSNASQIVDAPYFPLTGPLTLELSLLKTDNFSMYDLGYKYNPDPKVSSISLNFDTVGSKIDRKNHFLGVYDRKKSSVSMNLRTPLLKVAASGMLTLTPDVKQIDGSLSFDNANLLEIHAGVGTAMKRNIGYYDPFLTLVYKDKSILDLSGKVHYVQGVKYNADLKLKSPFQPVFINGNLKMQNNGYFYRAALNSSFMNAKLEGAVRKVSDYISSHAKVQYSIEQAEEQSIEVSNKMLLSTKGDADLKSIQSSAKFSEFPNYNFDVNWELRRGYRLFSHTLIWTLGGTKWETSQVYRHQYSDEHIDFQLLGLLSCKQKGIDYKVDVKYQTTDNSFISHAIAHLGKNHKYIASIEYLYNDKNSHSLAMELSYSKFNATIDGRLVESLPNTYEFYMDGFLDMKRMQRLSGVYTDGSSGVQQDHSFQIELTGVANWELSGALQATEESMKQWLQLVISKQKYREDITYTYDGLHNFDVLVLLADKSYKGAVSVSNTDREKGVTATLDMSTKLTFNAKVASNNGQDYDTVEVELTWNKVKHPNNRIYLIAESVGAQSNFILEFPGQQISGELIQLPGSIESKLQWHPNRIITATLQWDLALEKSNLLAKLETPWRGLEKHVLSAQHSINSQKAHCKVELSWKKENVVFLVTGEKETLNNDAWSVLANVKLFSTLKHLTNLTLNVNHINDKQIESNIDLTYGSQQTSLTFNHQTSISDAVTYFSLASPWLENSIRGKLTFKVDDASYNGSMEFAWSTDKEIFGNFVWLRNSHLSTIIQLVTPFEGYESLVTELLFKRRLYNINMLGKVAFNDNLYLLSLDRSDSDEYKTYGRLVTPFSKPIEVNIEHGVKINKEKNILIITFGDEEIIKFSKNSTHLGFPMGTTQVLFGLKLPSYLISFSMNNVFEDSKLELDLDGSWNDKKLSVQIQGNNTVKYNSYLLYFHAKIFGSYIKTPIELNFQHGNDMGTFNTRIQIPRGIFIQNNFRYESLFTWKNVLNIQTPWRSGIITNIQINDKFKLQHNLLVEADGKQTEAQLTYSMSPELEGVREFEAAIKTPWSHPVTVHYSSKDISNSQERQLKINFKQKKMDIRNVLKFELLEKFFMLQLESPYHEPLRLTASYNGVSSAKNVIMKMEWSSKVYELSSNIKTDLLDGFVEVVANGPNYDQQLLKLTMRYDFKYNIKFVDFHGLLGENEINATLSQGLCLYKLNLILKTFFNDWENVQVQSTIDFDRSEKSATLQIIKNANSFVILSSATTDFDYSKVNVTLKDTLFNIPSVSLYGLYDSQTSNYQILNIVCNYNQTIAELMFKLDNIQNIKFGSKLEVILKTPLKDLEFLMAQLSYENNNNNNQGMKILLSRNDWKLQIDGDATFDDQASNANLSLLLPFQDIRTLSASLSHKYASLDKQNINILIYFNDQKVEMVGNVVSSEKELSATMEIKAPIDGYESLKGYFNLNGVFQKQKTVSLGLLANNHGIKLSGTMNSKSLFDFHGDVRAEFPHTQQVATALLNYDLTGRNGNQRYPECLMVFPHEKYSISAVTDRPESGKMTVKLSFDTPALVSEITGFCELHPESLTANFNVVTNNIKVLVADLSIEPTLLNFHFTCPSIGYETLSLQGQLDWETQQKTMLLNFVKNGQEYKASLVTSLDYYSTELKLNIYTPIEDWNEVNIHGKYEYISDTAEEVKLVAVKGEQTFDLQGRWYAEDENIHGTLNILQSSFGTFGMSVNITAEECIARIRAEDNSGRNNLNAFLGISESYLQVILGSNYSQLQHINITTTFSATDFINSELEYRGIGSENYTFISKLQVSSDMILIKMDPFIFKPNLRNFNSTLLYKNMLNNLSNPFVSLYVNLNGNKLVESTIDINLDWESKLSVDYKFQSDPLQNTYFVTAWITPQHPMDNLHLTIKDKHSTWLQIGSVKKNIINNRSIYKAFLKTTSREMSSVLEVYPRTQFSQGSVNFTYSYNDQHWVFYTISHGNELGIDISLPFIGYDHFNFSCKYGEDFLKASFISPFVGYEQISLAGILKAFEYNKKKISLIINKNKSIFSTDIHLQYMANYAAISFDLVTPVKRVQRLRYEGQYDFREDKKICFLSLEINENTYKLSGETTLQNHSVDGVLLIVTPMTEFKNMKFLIGYDLLPNTNKTFMMQAEMNDIKHFDLQYSNSKGRLYLNSQLPFINTALFMTAKYDFSNIIRGHNVEGEMALQGIRTNMKINLSGKDGHFNQGRFEASVLRTDGPISMDVNFTLLNKNKEKGIELISNIQNKRIELKALSVVDFPNKFEMTLSSVLPSYRLNSINMQWNKSLSNDMDGEFFVYWKSTKIINIQTSLEQSSARRPQKFSIVLRTSFKNVEDITFTSVLSYSNGLMSESTLRWDKGKSIILIGSFNLKPHKANNKISLTTSFMEPSFLSIDYNFLSSEQTLDVKFGYGTKKMQMEVKYIPTEDNILLTVITPFHGFTHLQLDGKYSFGDFHNFLEMKYRQEDYVTHLTAEMTRDEENHLEAKASLITPVYMLRKFIFNGKFSNHSELESSLELYWGEKGFIIGNSSFSPLTARLQLNSTLENWEYIDVHSGFIHNDDLNVAHFILTYGNEVINATSTVTPYIHGISNVYISVRTPWTENIILEGSHRLSDGHLINLNAQHGMSSSQIQAKINYKIEDNLHDYKFEAVISDLGKLTVHTGYNKTQTLSNFFYKLEIGTLSIFAALENSRTKQDMASKFHLETPFKNLKKVNAITELNFAKRYGLLMFDKAGEIYKIHATLNLTKSYFGAQLNVESPNFNMSNADLHASFSMRSVNISLEALGKKINTESIFSLQEGLLVFYSLLEVPFVKSWERTSLSFNTDIKNFTGSLHGHWNTNDILAIVNLNPHTLHLIIETPFKMLKVVQLSGALTTVKSHHKFTGFLEWERFRLDANATLGIDQNHYYMQSIFKWNDNKNITMKGSILIPNVYWSGTNLKFNLLTPFKGLNHISIISEYKLEAKGSPFINFTLSTSNAFVSSLHSSFIYHKNENSSLNVQFNTTWLNKQVAFIAVMNRDPPKILNGTLNIYIPYQDSPILKIQGDINHIKFTADAQLQISDTLYSFSGTYKALSNDLTMALQLQMPRVNCQLSLHNFFGNVIFKGDAKIIVNENILLSSYEIQQSSMNARLSLNLPSLKIPESQVDIALDSSELEVTGSATCKFFKHEGKLSFNINKTLISSQKGRQYKVKKAYLSHISITLEHSYERVNKSGSLIMENNDNEVRILGLIITPDIAIKEASLVINKHSKSVYFKLTDKLSIELSFTPDSGVLLLSYSGKIHKLQYSLKMYDGFESTLQFISPSITNGKKSITVSYKNTNSKLQANLNTDIGSQHKSISLELEAQNDMKLMGLEIVSEEQRLLELKSKLFFERERFMAKMELHLNGFQHSIKVIHKPTFPLYTELLIDSPTLISQPVSVLLSTEDQFKAYAGYGDVTNQKYFMLEAQVSQEDGKLNVTLHTPFLSSLKVLNFNGQCLTTFYLQKLSASFSYLYSYDITPIEASFKFHASESLFYSHFRLKTPLKYHEHYEGLLHLPLSLDEDVHLNISLILPHVSYIYSATLTTLTESVQFGLILQHGGTFANATFMMQYSPKFNIFMELNTPFSDFRHYCLNLRGQKSLKDGNNVVNYVEWNDKRIEIRYSFLIEVRKIIVQMELNTPFQNFNQYAMKLQYENNERKIIIATFSYPGLEKPVGIEFDYLYRGIFDVNLIVHFRVPFLPDFQAATLLLGNKLNFDQGTYEAIASGNVNEKKLTLAIEGIMNDNQAKLEVQAQQNDKEIYLNIVHALDNNHKDFLLWEMRTPFPIVKDIKLFSLYGTHQLLINAFYDSKEIVGLGINSSNSHFNFELRNPIRPISLSYFNQFDKNGLFSVNFCWNLKDKLKSEVGVEYSSKITPEQRWELQSKLKFPTRTLSYDLISQFSVFKMENAMHFSWEAGKNIGYHILFVLRLTNATVFGRIDLPYRSFETTLQSASDQVSFGSDHRKVELLWDAADNRNKKVGLDVIYKNNALELKVNCAFLTHDIIIQLQNQFKKSTKHILNEKIITIIYSSKPEDVFTLGTLYEYDESDKISTGIVVNHKPSKLYYDIKLEFSNHAEAMRGKLNITYLNFNSKEIINLISFAKIVYQQPELEVFLKTNQNSLGFQALMWSQKKGYDGISVGCQMNQKEPLLLSGAMNTHKTAMELALSYGSMRHYSLKGQFPNWQEITAEAKHSFNDVTVHDGHISVRLNSSQLLWSRFQWSPRFTEDMKPAILEEYADINYVINAIGQSYLQLLNEEFQISFPVITLHDITDYTKFELNDILQDFQAIGYDLISMYERNDFFIKDINNILKSSCSQLYSLLQAVGRSIVDLIKTSWSTVKEVVSFLWKAWSMDYFIEKIEMLINEAQKIMSVIASSIRVIVKSIYQLEEVLRDAGKKLLSRIRWGIQVLNRTFIQISQDIESVMMKCIGILGKHVEKFIEELERQASYIQVEAMVIVLEAADVIENITATLVELPEVQYLLNVYAEYASWLEEFHLQEYLDGIMGAIIETVGSIANDVIIAINEIKMLLLGSTQAYFDDMDQVPFILCIKNSINEVYQKVIWFWKYYQLTDQVLKALNNMLEQSDSFMFDALSSIDSNFDRDSKTELVFRPEVGLVEYTQELPVEWDGFNELPKFEQFSWYQAEKRPEEEIANLDKYSYYLLDPLNTAVNKSIRALLPPFSKQAVIAGRKHFITFDNKFYDFEGECSYLLASDFLDNKFSAVISYEIQDHEVVKKSLTIVTEGYHINIGSDHRVSIDGKRTELPVKIGDSSWMTRTGVKILVHTNYGMTLECNLYHDICTMELNGWYFGKTGGLLGTFDNEPSNDISLPDGTVTSDIEYFAKNWQVGKSSQCQPRVRQTNEDEEVQEPSKMFTKICSSYFQLSSSPFSSCFPHIDPHPYYEMCLQDIRNSRNNSCLSAAIYVDQCKKHGIDVWIPPECVNCPLMDGMVLKAGEEKLFTKDTPQSADVVLVVEQASCLKSARIVDAVKKLDSALKAKRLTDVQYSVVGFGGSNFQEPHTRTADGEVWTSQKYIEKALNSLQFDSEDANKDVSVYDALWYAARLPFRGGVSKIIVLIQCHLCDDKAEINDYNDMLGLLQDNDIAFHVLQLDAINLDGSPEKSAKIFGMDMEGTYSARNLANLTPRKGLLRQVTLPKDLCIPLALETNGTVFNLNHMIGDRSQGTSKKFLDVWSRRVARDALPPECQKCQCVANQDSVGQLFCSKCQYPILEDVLQDLATMWSDEDDEPDMFYD